ncbi:MAG: arylsulfatase [Bacteroidales bacterium]
MKGLFNSTMVGIGVASAAGLAMNAGSCKAPGNNDQEVPPNIIYILADDLGYGDLGSYGQEMIETPNLDQLAEEGIRFTDHYSGSSVSAPARCVLLTGKHSGKAQIRGNHEWDERGDVWNYEKVLLDSTLEGQYPMRPETVTIGSVLQGAGYKTAMFGKWGLGAPHTQSIPTRKGFDYFVGYNCQRQAHTYYPVHLYHNEQRFSLNNDTLPPGTHLPEDADPYDPANYDLFTSNNYAPTVMFDSIISFVNQNDPVSTGDPFFIYWATPIPHVPLQAPQRWIDYYVDKFGDEEPFSGDGLYFPARYPRATYAAMVSYLDENIGLLIEQLKEMEIYDNTLIIFTSDNGPTFNGGSDSPWFDSGGPFKSEFGWGKAFLREGGIRVPMIASWPAHIEGGQTSGHISAFHDVLPTLSEIAETGTPEQTNGISFLPELTGGNQPGHEYLYWEQPPNQQAVRMDKWKGIRTNIREGDLSIELYNLEEDIQEQHNVADQHPEIIQEMETIMQNARTEPEIEQFRMEALGDRPR